MANLYLDQEKSTKLDTALFEEYKFSTDQLMEIAGLCVAQAVARCYPPSGTEKPRVLVCCGPGNNGGDGLVAARHLLFLGYEADIYYPKRSSKQAIFNILVTQCEQLDIPFLDALPSASDISTHYNIVMDAIFGYSFRGEVRAPFDSVLSTLKTVTVPLCSVDIPSGWDVEKGDVTGNGLKPDLLVSLTAPKPCAQYFSGRYHYLGLRMVPPKLASRFGLELPLYPGTDQIVRIV
ncbi:hypothetical protein EMCRGX_G005718 [Ephydatia muelleri]|eukprot:Em0007g1515a